MNQIALENFKIDKSNWKKVKLGDVVFEPKETVKDAVKEGIQHVVGLEHIDSEDIHLRRSASIDESTTFTKKFRKGDVLFGRRRAYLKKAAFAEFDGICSGDITVMRAKGDLVAELLPFVVNSDKFFDFAITHSAGGLSPRVKFHDIAKYSFTIPEIDSQAQLSRLLTSLDNSIEIDIHLQTKLIEFFLGFIEDILHGIKLNGKTIRQGIDLLESSQKVAKLSQLGVFFKGKGIPKSELIESGISCIRYGELYTTHHKHIREYQSFISESSAKDAFKIEKHDVLFASSGETIAEIGKSAAFVKDDICYAGSDILVFRPNNMDGNYLGYLMNSNFVRQQLNKLGTGATVMHIYASDLAKIKIPVITRDIQEKIGKELEQIQTCIENLGLKIESSRLMQKSLINQIF